MVFTIPLRELEDPIPNLVNLSQARNYYQDRQFHSETRPLPERSIVHLSPDPASNLTSRNIPSRGQVIAARGLIREHTGTEIRLDLDLKLCRRKGC